MSRLLITGQERLEGEISVYGAKNSVLPIIAATVLNGKTNVIKNCPNLSDVYSAFEILRKIGCRVEYDSKSRLAIIDSADVCNFCIHEKLMREMRSSVIFLGPLIARCRKAVISYPGGCELGPRPIDLHLKSLKQLGVEIEESHGYINCKLDKIKPQAIHLSFPSVGATENIMLVSSISEGETKIINAAREPEIIDLQNYLNKMGANIRGAGSEIITIDGCKKFNSVEHTVIPDRIVASTYLSGVACSGGEVLIKNVEPTHIHSLTSLLVDAGSEIKEDKDSILIKCDKRISQVGTIKTMPYPGFATDSQAIAMSVFCKASGTTVFIENMFENRYKHVQELVRMGADITVDGRVAVVKGVKDLFGANVKARDLRGGAALVIAALGANGTTEISGIEHIDRGYESIEREFETLGANIHRLN